MSVENLSAVDESVKSQVRKSSSAAAIAAGKPVGGAAIAADVHFVGLSDELKPPLPKRGVRISVCVDWFTASFIGESAQSWKQKLEQLKWLSFAAEKAQMRHGYEGVICAGYGKIGALKSEFDKDGNREESVNGLVDLSGEACRHLLASGVDGVELVKRLIDEGGKPTRIDLAIDVFEEGFSPARLHKLFKQGRCVTRARIDPEIRGKVREKKDAFETFTFGSNDSEKQLTIYNKTVEQKKKGKQDVPENWTRLEMRFADEYAVAAAHELVRTGWPAVQMLISDFIAFDDKLWKKIFTESMRLPLPVRPISPPEKKKQWFLSEHAGLTKILKLIILCGFEEELQAVLNAVQVSDLECERWVRAFQSFPYIKNDIAKGASA